LVKRPVQVFCWKYKLFTYCVVTFQTSIVTTRRVFERIVVRHVSQRTAWKLLKGNNASLMRSLDISKSYHYALGYCGFMDPLFGDNRHCIISSCSCREF
jgi:uncharacterized membrane protein